jgi:ABC-2 type transport system permease protein
MLVRAFYAVIERDVQKMLRQRARLLAALARSLLWLLVIGAGFGALQPGGGAAGRGLTYQAFLVPGVLGMTMLFGAVLAALSTVYDRESGFMRMLIIAPLPHAWIVLAKTVGAAVVALIQAAMLLVLLVLLGRLDRGISFGTLICGLAGTALACASLGSLIAAWSGTLENFAGMMNFVLFPVFFLSGSLYPVERLPPALQLVATLNPYSHGVDLLRHALRAGPAFSIGLDAGVLGGFTVIAVIVASLRFSGAAAGETRVRRLAR